MNAPVDLPTSNLSIVGQRVGRVEDDRHLHGAGRFLADIRLPGTRHVAFVRSNVAHGKLNAIRSPDLGVGESVWTAASIASIARPIVATLNRPGFQRAPYPALATDRVRFVGQPIAAVVAASQARAEDLAELVVPEVEALPALVDALAALAPGAPLMHEGWQGNHFLRTERTVGAFEEAVAAADVHVTRQYRMGRAAPTPLETRGCIARYDRGTRRLTVYSTSQRPTILRDFLAEQLAGMDARRIQVIVVDGGGAFGVKTNLYPEELALAAIALQVDYPVRWIEDRLEHMISACHAREQHQTVTLHARRDGTILAVEADIVADGGAYSMLPSTSAIEGNMTTAVLLGPYRVRNYRFRTTSACTNKTPIGPYRGVGRPAACFAMERSIDELAYELRIEPHELRRRNLIEPEEFPWTTPTGLVYDSGDYPAMLRTALEALDRTSRAEQNERTGIGYAYYVEQTAHTAKEFLARGSAVLYGFESARVKLDLSGALTIETSVQSHGQGHATTLAQIASEVTSIPIASITVHEGDTDVVPYGNGTSASRSIVLAGGATYQACTRLAERMRRIAAKLMGVPIEATRIQGQAVAGPTDTVQFRRIAQVALQHVYELPDDVEPGLEFMSSYRPPVETGAFASGLHVAKVAVNVDTGATRVLDYLVVEDCGRAVNPMIVDGQVYGGVAQGIGQALYEVLRYDENGQPQSVTLADYLLPGFTEVPEVRIEHQETLSPFTVFGMKGTGEGGCIGGPAAIGNAVSDALRDLDVAVTETPITPASVWRALARARTERRRVYTFTR